jgi:hypothetical protein
MYDIITSALVFFLLVPGVVLTLPPGASAMVSAAVHAIVFYVVLRYASDYVPFWAIWIVAGGLLAYKMFVPASSSAYPTATGESMYAPSSPY